MKRSSQLLVVIFISISSMLSAADIFVSTNGNDFNSGDADSPLRSIAMAQRKARELRRLNDPSVKEGINIILEGGTYRLIEPLLLRPEDSGTAESPTRYISAEGQEAVISGGVEVTSWKKLSGSVSGISAKAKGKLWVADVPRVGGQRLLFRQMWVNNKKAVRATSFNDGELDRILSVDNEKQILWIPKPKFSVKAINNLEFTIHQWWAIANLRVKTMKTFGDSVAVTFYQPESKVEFEHPWPAPFIDSGDTLNGNSAFFFTNAMELLNSPGEWYEDFDNGKVYYWPREDESIKSTTFEVPYLENVIKIMGSLELPVHHVSFEGVTVANTTWLRPSLQGHVPLQAGMSLLEAYKLQIPGTPDKAALENQGWIERQPAGISVKCANNISFKGCKITQMAATGIDLEFATNHNTIQGCIISDIGGTGIQVGYFGGSDFEAHLPYNPTDKRELCHHEYIANNVVTDVTNEDWGCVGISVGFAHDINIEHNEVSHLNYSGICVGWGWTKTITCMKNNRVHANHIHHFAKMMYDVGGVYTLSAQPNSEVSENSIHHLMKAPYAHIPEHYQYIYYDEGSSFIRSVNNWTEKDKFFSNTPGPGNEWINNGPQVADSIKNAAGLLPEYKYLLEEVK